MGMRRTIPGSAPAGHGPREGAASPPPLPESDAAPSPSLYSAVQRPGLKLEARKVAIEYLVIEKAERVQTEN
jgi:uncharacterized protein (TIGR03435 family)